MPLMLSNRMIESDKTAIWANNDAANTTKTVNFSKRPEVYEEYMITVYNPSAVADITMKIFTIAPNLAGANRDSLLDSKTFPKGQTTSYIVHGPFISGDLKLILYNNTILGAADAFTATIRVREVM